MRYLRHLVAPVAVSILLPFLSVSGSVVRQATVCNGQAEFCSRSYGNISFVGAHDSYAVSSTNLAANQDYDVTQQLNDGIRLLQLQTHSESDGIHCCHTSCLLFDGGLLSDYLTKVLTWIKANPNDVVTLLIVNSDDLQASAFAAVYQQVGMDAVSFSPANPVTVPSAWPTLSDIIAGGKTAITFLDNGADSTQATYLLDEFSQIWETAFDVTDQTFDCNVNRTGTATGKMYLINHYLDTLGTIVGGITSLEPDKAELLTTNAVSGFGSLGLQADNCGAMYGSYPNFLLVDFYDYGNGSVFEVAATLNGVSYTAPSTLHPPAASSSNSTTTVPGAATRGVSLGPFTALAGFLAAAFALSL